MAITYSIDDSPTQEDLVELYGSVKWAAYTHDPARLTAAIRESLNVVTARDDGKLVGLARIVGDGLTIAYLQDILVDPQYHRLGVGRELFIRVFEPYRDVRQRVVMTDDEPQQRGFYEAMGFTEVRDLDFPIRVFAKFD